MRIHKKYYQRENALIFNRILSTNFLRMYGILFGEFVFEVLRELSAFKGFLCCWNYDEVYA